MKAYFSGEEKPRLKTRLRFYQIHRSWKIKISQLHENWSTRKYQGEEIIVSQFFRDSISLNSVKDPIFHDFIALMGEIHLVAR